jgi:hypothetical protein
MSALDLYVGNVTTQNHIFLYRLSEDTKIVERPIPAGKQIKIECDSRDLMDGIIKQHAKYGLMDSNEVTRVKRFHGLCYSIGKPIPADKLNYFREHNNGELADQGRELRRLAAIAGSELMETALLENDRPERVDRFDLFIQEDRQDDSPFPQLSDRIVVTKNPDQMGPEPVAPAALSRRARRKAA